MKRLRAEIEPVPARDYLRFLFDWQGVSPDAQREGSQALDAVIEQLAGFEAPAAAWEGAILPARITDYDPSLLDDACLSGRVAWARLGARGEAEVQRQANGSPEVDADHSLSAQNGLRLGAAARRGTSACERQSAESGDFHRENGASFFDEIVEGTHLLHTQVEEALAELVAVGQVVSDSFGGLRALLTPPRHHRRRAAGARLACRQVVARQTQGRERCSKTG